MSQKDFANLLSAELNKHSTEKGDLSHITTDSYVLDLFSQGGSIRNLNDANVIKKLSKAFSEDEFLTIRTILWLSDIRHGQGERKFFKNSLLFLASKTDENTMRKVLLSVPEFGRWDYLFDFIDHKVYGNFVWNIIETEFRSGKLSLLFKWLPSIRRKSDRHLAIKFASKLKITHESYRKIRTAALKELRIVEQDMANNEWAAIDYSKVPSRASLIYRDAFKRHDSERYAAFVNSAIKGEKKINASTLYPHELVHSVFDNKYSDTIEALWKNLPNYITVKDKSILPMVDVSGSMTSKISNKSSISALEVAIGFGLYLSERLSGPFKDKFLTFSSVPKLTKVVGRDLREKITNMSNAHWTQSTNIVGAFDAVLRAAIEGNLSQEDLPTTIVIFSDMQFNSSWSGYSMGNKTPLEFIEKKFKDAGYKLPNVVFWNLQARTDSHPVTKDKTGTALVSGFSPVTLKYVLNDVLKTPYDLMLEVIMNERYNIWK